MNAERHAQLLQFLTSLGLKPQAGMDLQRLDEALTHTSAGLCLNHEKLEFLGMPCCAWRPRNSWSSTTPT